MRDTAESHVRDTAQTEQTAMEETARLAARGYVIAGGTFWMVAAFLGPYVFHDTSFAESLGAALWPFLATVLTLAIGWYFERVASALLVAASAAVLVWGILYQWDVGVWILMTVVLLAPMLIAAVLFFLAAREERRRAYAPEPQPVTEPSTDEAVTGSEKGTAPEDTAGARGAMLRTWIMGAVVGLLAFAVAVPVYFTATPKQCASCHEMEAYYESWQSSSHEEVTPTCLDCHVEPGFLNLAWYEVAFYGEIVGHLAGADVEMAGVTTPGLESCQRDDCHSLNTEAPYSEEVLVAHKTHVEDEGIECPDCHPGVVHEGVGGRSMIPAMEQCSECHADQMGDCDYCHSEGPPSEAPETH